MLALHMENNKPFVQAAFVCENVLVENDGVPTIIRIVDTVTANIPSGLPPDKATGFPINVFVRLCSEEIPLKGKISIQSRRPDKTKGGKFEQELEFTGNGNGIQFKTAFFILNPQDGIYWFDVFWNGERITLIPVVIKRIEASAEIVPSATLAAPKQPAAS